MTSMTIRALAARAILSTATMVAAHEFKHGELRIAHPWARATTIDRTAAYLQISNVGSEGDRLLGAEAEIAERVELHMTKTESGVARMLPVDAIAVPARKTIALEPGGYHIMLVGLKRKLAANDTVPLTLVFERAGKVAVQLAVQKSAGMGH
ncbi:MAG: copper chaperone PCu(A)C [Alphaproteobacteria bacterium]